ncbi:MAG: antitoxin family protein [Desulfurococcales archaeon]|nr:antitoxin family protein [Desulfurococcales archaeon]
MSKVIKVEYERGVLKPLEPVVLQEGEGVRIRIERSVRERLKGHIGILGESSEEKLEKYLEEAQAQ